MFQFQVFLFAVRWLSRILTPIWPMPRGRASLIAKTAAMWEAQSPVVSEIALPAIRNP